MLTEEQGELQIQGQNQEKKMYRSYEYHNSSYSMDEYLERLDRIQRMPSLTGEYPSFPNVHEVLNNKTSNKAESKDHQKKVTKENNQQKNQQNPEKKVHFSEQDEKPKEEEKSIDEEADGFIQKKHKGFALCKWDTFKVY